MARKKTGNRKTPHLPHDVTVGEGMQILLADARQSLHRHRLSTSTKNSEAVHHFRVGVRRLRSVLWAFKDILPDRERRALNDRLRAAAQRFGRAREWDVFLSAIVAPLRAQLPEEPALIELQHLAEEARDHALPPGDTLKSIVMDVEAALNGALWLQHPAAGLDAPWHAPLHDYAAGLLSKHHRRLRKRLKHIDLADRDAFHKLRVRVKKLRYLAELVGLIFPPKQTKKYLKALVAVQDVMGALNDAVIAQVLLDELLVPPHAHHLVTGWIAHDNKNSSERFPAVARDFRRAEPFWES